MSKLRSTTQSQLDEAFNQCWFASLTVLTLNPYSLVDILSMCILLVCGDPKHVQHCAQSILGNVPSLHMHPKNWAGFEPVSIFLMAGARSEFETGFEQVSGQSSRTTVHTVVVKKFLSAEKHASLFRTLGFFEHN